MKTDNPIRRLREQLRLSQPAFAQLIGRSHQSVGNYERGNGDVPAEVIERLKTICAEHGYADLALELSSNQWEVRRVLHPGETLISARPADTFRHQSWHIMLDEILDSEVTEAIHAVQSNLVVFQKYVAAKSPKTRMAASSKIGKDKRHNAS